MHFVGQGELSDPTHHWVLVTTHKKVGGAFCGVPHNQVGLCDRHQSNPLMDTWVSLFRQSYSIGLRIKTSGLSFVFLVMNVPILEGPAGDCVSFSNNSRASLKVRALFIRVLSGGNGCCPGRINARGGLPVHQAVWRCARLARGYSPAFRHRAHCHWNNSKQMRTMMEDWRWQKGTHFCLWISSSHIDLWNTPYSFCFLLPQWQELLLRCNQKTIKTRWGNGSVPWSMSLLWA